jgi:hypothetical protein
MRWPILSARSIWIKTGGVVEGCKGGCECWGCQGGGRCRGGVAVCTVSESSWSLSSGGRVGGKGTQVLWRGGGSHAVGCSGRGTSEWGKHWTRAVQYFPLEASLIQSLRER